MSDDERRRKSSNRTVRAQKKVAGRVGNRTLTRTFVNQRINTLLDAVHELCRLYKNKQHADRLVKCVLKLTAKIAVLYNNHVFAESELELAKTFHYKFAQSAMLAYTVSGVASIPSLISLLDESYSALRRLISRHLSQKSLDRAQFVFDLIREEAFLRALLSKQPPFAEPTQRLVELLAQMTAEGLV